MIFKPAQLGMAKLDKQELVEDRKSCKRSAPCGVGEKALYLNSFFIDRRYYLPYGSISRVFKRVAMSSGGFYRQGNVCLHGLPCGRVRRRRKAVQFQARAGRGRPAGTACQKEQPQLHLLSAAGEQAGKKGS